MNGNLVGKMIHYIIIILRNAHVQHFVLVQDVRILIYKFLNFDSELFFFYFKAVMMNRAKLRGAYKIRVILKYELNLNSI